MTGSRETRAGVTLGARYAFVVGAFVFLVTSLVQVFLAGLAVFDPSRPWAVHRDFGYLITFLPVLLVIIALVGRLPRRFALLSALLVVLFILQSVFVAFRGPMPAFAALHPVNGFLIVFGAVTLARWARPLVAPPLGTASA